MKRIVSIAAVFLCGISLLQAQLLRVSDALKELKMENISVVENKDTITVAFETSTYRGIYRHSLGDVVPYRKYRLCSCLYWIMLYRNYV